MYKIVKIDESVSIFGIKRQIITYSQTEAVCFFWHYWL